MARPSTGGSWVLWARSACAPAALARLVPGRASSTAGAPGGAAQGSASQRNPDDQPDEGNDEATDQHREVAWITRVGGLGQEGVAQARTHPEGRQRHRTRLREPSRSCDRMERPRGCSDEHDADGGKAELTRTPERRADDDGQREQREEPGRSDDEEDRGAHGG